MSGVGSLPYYYPREERPGQKNSQSKGSGVGTMAGMFEDQQRGSCVRRAVGEGNTSETELWEK